MGKSDFKEYCEHIIELNDLCRNIRRDYSAAVKIVENEHDAERDAERMQMNWVDADARREFSGNESFILAVEAELLSLSFAYGVPMVPIQESSETRVKYTSIKAAHEAVVQYRRSIIDKIEMLRQRKS